MDATAVTSAAAAAVAVLIATMQVIEAKLTRRSDQLSVLYGAHQGPEAIRARHLIRQRLREIEVSTASGAHSWSEEDIDILRPYINGLNFAWLFINRGLVQRDLAIEIFGNGSAKCWTACKDYIGQVRIEENKPDFGKALELAVAVTASSSRLSLRRQRP